MNPESDTDHPALARFSDNEEGLQSSLPANWREAILVLVTSRISLIQLESKEAAGKIARRLVLWIISAVCGFFTWALMLAAGIAVMAKSMDCKWYWIALGCAVIHLAAALILAIIAKKPGTPAFPVCRAEFKKDREWIVKL